MYYEVAPQVVFRCIVVFLGVLQEESRISPIPSPTRSPRNLSTLVSLNIEKLQELTVTHPTPSSGSSEPKPSAIHTRDQDDPHDDAYPEGENNAKRQKTSEYEAYVSGESSSGQDN
ncbi:hypothetical protein Tco_0958194, partial [Tanacetum coccineum]